MKTKTLILFCIFICGLTSLKAQKKILNHDVYDSWKSVVNETLTNDGNYVIYCINPQEGDGQLFISNTKTQASFFIDRGYDFKISPDQKNVIFLIKPPFLEIRDAKIKKKKTDEMPKDSLGILKIGNQNIIKIPNVKSYKMGKDTSDYIAYLLSQPNDTTGNKKKGSKKNNKIGNPLVLRSLKTGKEDTIKFVTDYTFSNNGKYLAAIIQPDEKDSIQKAGVLLYDFTKNKTHNLKLGKGDYKQPVFDKSGLQLSFLTSYDTTKTNPKKYELYYFKQGLDSAFCLANTSTEGLPEKWSVSEHYRPKFSEDGKKLLFGIAPIRPPKDTTIVDFEVATLDIWHWSEPDLQAMQVKNLETELKRNYLSVIYPDNPSKIIPLANERIKNIYLSAENNSDYALGLDDTEYRLAMQWEGHIRNDIYVISLIDGTKTLIKKALSGRAQISSKGNYIIWYDIVARQWFSYSIKNKSTICLTDKIGVNFWDEKHDTPSDPPAYGIAGWTEDDKRLLIYDSYDIWQFDPEGVNTPVNLTEGIGRKSEITFRYIKTDSESKCIKLKNDLLISAFDNESKESGFYILNFNKKNKKFIKVCLKKYSYSKPIKAKNANIYAFKQGNFNTFPNLYITNDNWKTQKKITDANPQMNEYNWGTAELFKWKTYDDIDAEGIIYKPEDFDSTKKYPMLVYFYEKYSDDLYRYYAPTPSRSIINFPFFVSRGYIVFVPNIYYTDGYPGMSAYNSIISGAKELCKKEWVDSTRMGIQGQSWGGYQVAYLITQTNMFKAAGAGAPVSNMTSAYGGIRWESGHTRQFQYERQQSRIGESLWDGFDLYIINSPLFYANKVKTPLLIMHNDNDGAVPWYQGIEYFTALRRLGKPVWLLQYNNEAHNLKERRNSKDLSIRLQQFFDHYLKNDKIPEWMKYGIPATKKGYTWGYDLIDE